MRSPISVITALPVGEASTTAPSGSATPAGRWLIGDRPKASSSSSLRPITRSAQAPSCHWNWRTGMASKNSLATKIVGARGMSSMRACHWTAWPVEASVACCTALSRGLISTRWTLAALRKDGFTRPVRSMSAISVPRPGPSSASTNGSGEPIISQTPIVHRPTSSPKIWLISGAVMKSPARPKGSPRM